MASSQAPFRPSSLPPAYKRSVKNYLIDSRFQLKWTGLIIGVALVISAFLGAFLWRTSQQVVAEGEKVVAQSQRLVEESKKVSDVVRMSMRADPIYGQNAELTQSFGQASAENERGILDQQAALLAQQRANVERQTTMLAGVVAALVLLVLLIGVLGIYFTHKVAGPVFKMKRLLGQVADGKLVFQAGRLRKGDELQEFYDVFMTMVEKLRERQAAEVAQLSRALELAREAGAPPDSIHRVEKVRDEMRRALED